MKPYNHYEEIVASQVPGDLNELSAKAQMVSASVASLQHALKNELLGGNGKQLCGIYG